MALAQTSMELVLTVPIETQLGVEGIRDGQLVWLEMIREARKSLSIEQFYITDEMGEPLRPVLDAIRDAGSRGVVVRLIADEKFFKTYPRWVTEVGNYPSAEARTLDFAPGVQHAKFFVADGENVFVGSHNFDWRALKHIHEVGVRVRSRSVGAKMEDIFNADWAAGITVAGGVGKPMPLFESHGTYDSDPIRVLASPASKNPKGIEDSLTVILEKLAGAKKTIALQLYEYSTVSRDGRVGWKTLDEALRKAAGRGVSVRLLVDATALKKDKNGLVSLGNQKNVVVKATTIPQYSGGLIDYARLIHSKYLIIDEMTLWVGTENWSRGYFENSRNVGLVFTDRQVAASLSSIFDRVWESELTKTIEGTTRVSLSTPRVSGVRKFHSRASQGIVGHLRVSQGRVG